MKKLLLLTIGIFFLISLISASDLGTFKQNECIELYQYCDDCSYVNVTSVKSPNSSIDFINTPMTKTISDFNYTYCNTSALGDYFYTVCGDKEGTHTCENIDFGITKLGVVLSQQESYLYIFLSIIILGMFLLSLYFAIAIPYKNKTNEKGAVIKITKLKYLKLLFISLSYMFLVVLMNLLVGLSTNFLSLTIFYGFISFLFTTLINLTYPVAIFILVVALFEIIKDANLYGIIKKFGSAEK